jgi:hypothetical protein
VAVETALASGETRLQALQDDYPNLRAGIAELGRVARWGAERGARIRVTYLLSE